MKLIRLIGMTFFAVALAGCSSGFSNDSVSGAITDKGGNTEKSTNTGSEKAAAPLPVKGFVHAEKGMLYDGNGEELFLKGIGFGNRVWRNPTAPVETDHTEASFKELRDMGFNSARFYMNYQIFEDDASPYEYKEAGWEWLDRNVEWAEKYNIYLILNIHCPQGGFQPNGDGMQLWTDVENQKRLTALWVEIAKRYKDEPIIAGYGLLNEPTVPKLSNDRDTLAQMTDLVGSIAKAVREVDKNHLFSIENLNAAKDMKTGVTEYGHDYNGYMNFCLIDDENAMYEFHTYVPSDFTHQNASWLSYLKNKFTHYPNEDTPEKWDKAYLLSNIKKYIPFRDANNVPLYLGEFGCILDAFKNDRGAEKWISDMLDICFEYNIGFNYHVFHEGDFGLYQNSSDSLPDMLNISLKNLFEEKLRDKKD